jgi:putative sterol carrier protein
VVLFHCFDLRRIFLPQTSEILAALAAVFEGYNAEEKAAQLKKVRAPLLLICPFLNCSLLGGTSQNNGIFEFRVKNADGKEAWWTIDLKKTCTVKKGEAKSLGLKQDVTIILSDETFVELADGKTTGQKAFMTGKLKTKGNMMLATKLDGVLKVCLVPSFTSVVVTAC